MAKGKRKLSAYNRHVQREMKKGKSMKQAASSWKRGGSPKRKYGGTWRKTRVTGGSKRKSNPKGGKRRMARKRGGFNQQKLFKLVRLAALAIPAAEVALSADSLQNKMVRIGKRYTGFDMSTGQFNLGHLIVGYGPLFGATLATYGIPKLAGIIRGL